jgi:hypothetical protein
MYIRIPECPDQITIHSSSLKLPIEIVQSFIQKNYESFSSFSNLSRSGAAVLSSGYKIQTN